MSNMVFKNYYYNDMYWAGNIDCACIANPEGCPSTNWPPCSKNYGSKQYGPYVLCASNKPNQYGPTCDQPAISCPTYVNQINSGAVDSANTANLSTECINLTKVGGNDDPNNVDTSNTNWWIIILVIVLVIIVMLVIGIVGKVAYSKYRKN
jgi:hypothetical protein